ncbi:MAG: aminotransferase class V-fold PLP-dependent enzyme [Bacteroidetes Order II. Incertae sedis bacterium]|nr:aminotransferase class V-fold PLP-dependent enzyme [Bacteroidetes Order II. bacterium]
MSALEAYFSPFRRNIVGIDQTFHSPYGELPIIYADWIASGRLYSPIEKRLSEVMGPWVANTHTETSVTGTSMTHAYHEARHIIKKHVNANENDMIISAGSGMTGVINKLQRIIGVRVPEKIQPYVSIPESERPVVFVTHMEHHSNQTSWLEAEVDLEVLEPDNFGRCVVQHLEQEIVKYAGRPLIGSFSACSNVTGLHAPFYELSRVMHQHGGWCFVDFAASAPYEDIDMHPGDPLECLDAVFFSPHKFLGGPGSSGIMVFNSKLDQNRVPDHPGGGTVDWTNPWGEHQFVANLEDREDGGTPAFLQTIRAALCIKLKEEMGTQNIIDRERELLAIAFPRMRAIPHVNILADKHEDRLGVISFYVEDVHFNLIVKLLNDRYGVQTRGGCSCAGTYGHFLLHVDPMQSKSITDQIDAGILSNKPGWVRLSLHPTMTDAELDYILTAIEQVVEHAAEWSLDYEYDSQTNEYTCILDSRPVTDVKEWFNMSEALVS